MPIPPDNVAAGQTGHLQAHQQISDTLTAHDSQLQGIPAVHWGKAALVGGTVTVSLASVTANSVVLVSRLAPSGALGRLSVPVVSPGAGFTIASDSPSENSQVAWLVLA
jgi:hypothetical protein